MVMTQEEARARAEQVIPLLTESISAERFKRGLPNLMPSSILGSQALAAIEWVVGGDGESPSEEQVYSEYSGRVKDEGYQGLAEAHISYFVRQWPQSTPVSQIAQDFADLFFQSCVMLDWVEDMGVGYIGGVPNDDPSALGVGIAIGVGCTGGTAPAIAEINNARKSVGAAPVEVNYGLRQMVRKYIELPDAPEGDALFKDSDEMYQDRNLGTVRLAYYGGYSSLRADGAEITVNEIGSLVGRDFINGEFRSTLLRTDWQHIGMATRVVPDGDRLRTQSEFVLAWFLPLGASRPPHFPPPIDFADASALKPPQKQQELESWIGEVWHEQEPRSKRRWWPFGRR